MKQTMFGIQVLLFSALTGLSSPLHSTQVETIVLDLPADFRPTKVKVFPKERIYALSGPQSRMVLLDAEGSFYAEIDLMEHTSTGVRHFFFDFAVDRNGSIYVYAVWREPGQQVQSSVFKYGKAGAFERRIPLSRHVDGRCLLVDDSSNFYIAGLDADLYFGRSSELFGVHVYDSEGIYSGAFLKIDWETYLSADQSSVADAYRNIRPLLDHLPIGLSQSEGVYVLVPGMNLVEFYDPYSLELRNSVDLTSPVLEEPQLSEQQLRRLGGLSGTGRASLVFVQVSRGWLIAEWESSRTYRSPDAAVRQRALAFYERGRSQPYHVGSEMARAVSQVGRPVERIFILSREDGKLLLKSWPLI